MNRIIIVISCLTFSLGIMIGLLFFGVNQNDSIGYGAPLSEVINKIRPAVVSISVQKTDNTGTTSRDGTGIIIQRDGIILTSKHLIDSTGNHTVTLDDGTQIPATLIKVHPTLDMALLGLNKTTGKNLEIGKFISSQALIKQGQSVIAIGNTLGLYPGSVSSGIISGLNRNVSFGGIYYNGLLQTSLPMVLGNSGGPLIISDGTIIGMNIGIVGGTSQIGWTLPLTQEEVDTFSETK